MWRAVELSAKTAALSETPKPFGSPSGPGLWKHKGWKLPNYIEQVAHGLVKSGHDESEAIQIAIGVIKNWASGGGKVTPEVRAASAKAIAEWESIKARAGASKSEHARQAEAIQLVTKRVNQSASTILDDGGSGKGFNITDRQAQDLTGFDTRAKSDYNARRMSGMTHDEAIRRAKGQSVRGM